MVSVVSPGINRRKERHHISWRLFLLSVTLPRKCQYSIPASHRGSFLPMGCSMPSARM